MAKNDSYIAYILKELRSGVAKRDKVMAKFVKKWQTSQRTFDRVWKIAQETYRIEAKEVEKEVVKVMTTDKIESVSNGLKSKFERLMNLQRQADDIQRMLDSNITPDIVKSPKQMEYIEIKRELTYIERATLMKSLRDLQAEISKIEGDYAAVKQDVSVKDLRDWTINPK